MTNDPVKFARALLARGTGPDDALLGQLADDVERLRAALRPFAENARRFGNPLTDEPVQCIEDDRDIAAIGFDEVGVTAGDMRSAAEALAKSEGRA